MNVFSEIYRQNAWNGDESLSGPGSGDAATHRIRREIRLLVEELEIQSVLDAACGDGYWMPDLPGYIGIDVAPQAIRRARANHPERAYMSGDIASMRTLPTCQLVVTRDAMQHLSLADGQRFLDRLVTSGAGWLLASTYRGVDNIDVATGEFYSPNLEAEPFNLGAPERLIFDGYDYQTGTEIRDPFKFLGLWRL